MVLLNERELTVCVVCGGDNRVKIDISLSDGAHLLLLADNSEIL